MPTIRFFQEHELSDDPEDSVDDVLAEFYEQGWNYDEDYRGSDIAELMITDPRSKEWKLDGCIAMLNKGLEFGNEDQIWALRAMKYLNTLYFFAYREGNSVYKRNLLGPTPTL